MQAYHEELYDGQNPGYIDNWRGVIRALWLLTCSVADMAMEFIGNVLNAWQAVIDNKKRRWMTHVHLRIVVA